MKYTKHTIVRMRQEQWDEINVLLKGTDKTPSQLIRELLQSFIEKQNRRLTQVANV